MKFTLERPVSVTIRSASRREIRVGDTSYERTIALTGDTVFDEWNGKNVTELAEDDFTALLKFAPEVIILGTGTANVFPPRELVFAMARRGIGFEFMDTPAAARTFNVLVSEGRQVAAVLYLDKA